MSLEVVTERDILESLPAEIQRTFNVLLPEAMEARTGLPGDVPLTWQPITDETPGGGEHSRMLTVRLEEGVVVTLHADLEDVNGRDQWVATVGYLPRSRQDFASTIVMFGEGEALVHTFNRGGETIEEHQAEPQDLAQLEWALARARETAPELQRQFRLNFAARRLAKIASQ